ncbi:MAG TPA: hypothetical protein VJ869_09905 [Sphaerochaeta sp.]|nr:hypothetical protein [Sphaerochaeta sp.]
MENKNKHKPTPFTKTFSIRVDSSTLEKVSEIARQKDWSRNKTISYLIEQQILIAEEARP